MSNRRDNMLGVILIAIGILIFLLNTDILSKDILLVLVGVGFLAGYYNKKVMGYLIAGLIVLAIGVGDLLEEYVFTAVDLSGFLFMWALGIVFLLAYFSRGTKGFLYPGCILPAIGTFALIEDIYQRDLGWLLFLLLAASFLAIYLIEYRKTNNRAPLIPATVLSVISILFLLKSVDIINYSFWKFVSYIWPIIIILIGLRILYNNYTIKRQE